VWNNMKYFTTYQLLILVSGKDLLGKVEWGWKVVVSSAGGGILSFLFRDPRTRQSPADDGLSRQLHTRYTRVRVHTRALATDRLSRLLHSASEWATTLLREICTCEGARVRSVRSSVAHPIPVSPQGRVSLVPTVRSGFISNPLGIGPDALFHHAGPPGQVVGPAYGP